MARQVGGNRTADEVRSGALEVLCLATVVREYISLERSPQNVKRTYGQIETCQGQDRAAAKAAEAARCGRRSDLLQVQ